MEISTSILSITDKKEENIKKLANTSTNYIHLDIMDGKFVPYETSFIDEKEVLINTKKPLDIHLMVEDVLTYVQEYKKFNPTYITFHLEVNENINEIIKEIKKICKVGISIKPNTKVEELIEYLDDIDLVLVMSVEPGKGGQEFNEKSIEKVESLYNLRGQNGYHYKIEVDGGINSDTIKKVSKCDIVVSGSYITNSNDYEKQIKNLII